MSTVNSHKVKPRAGDPAITPALVAEHGITPFEYERLLAMMGREPTFTELRQFVFDTQTNKVFDFTVKNMEILLKNDAELYAEFMKLKKRAKADSIFIYLRKYNEKHPLYLASK